MISADIQLILPELLLSVYAMVALILAVYTVKDRGASLLVWAFWRHRTVTRYLPFFCTSIPLMI